MEHFNNVLLTNSDEELVDFNLVCDFHFDLNTLYYISTEMQEEQNTKELISM